MGTCYCFPFCGKSLYTKISYYAGTLQDFTLKDEIQSLKTKYLGVIYKSVVSLNLHKSQKFHNEKQEAF